MAVSEHKCAYPACGKTVGIWGYAVENPDTHETRYYCNEVCMLADFRRRANERVPECTTRGDDGE